MTDRKDHPPLRMALHDDAQTVRQAFDAVLAVCKTDLVERAKIEDALLDGRNAVVAIDAVAHLYALATRFDFADVDARLQRCDPAADSWTIRLHAWKTARPEHVWDFLADEWVAEPTGTSLFEPTFQASCRYPLAVAYGIIAQWQADKVSWNESVPA